MKNLSISNIAWENNQINDVLNILDYHNIDSIEVALTKINGSWDISKEDLISYKKRYKNKQINSIQSINFLTTLNLFYDNKEFISHIEKVIWYSCILGAKKIVFGSPKNRFANYNDSSIDCKNIFIETMQKIGDMCISDNILFCIEPNAKVYGCNFITNSSECQAYLKEINHKNIRLHLDAACMFLEDDKIDNVESKDIIEHYHISQPLLESFDSNNGFHNNFNYQLKKINYKKTFSIEMKYLPNNLEKINQAIIFAKETYCL